jgi:hypothetical protein
MLMNDQILKMKVTQHDEGDTEISNISEALKPANRVTLSIDEKGKKEVRKGKNGQDNRTNKLSSNRNDFSVEVPKNRITMKDYEMMYKDRGLRSANVSKFVATEYESIIRTNTTSPI